MNVRFLLYMAYALLWLGMPVNSYSQITFENIQKLSVNDGLSNNSVLEIEQDKYGRIWIATEWGINCYNGTQIKKYLYDAQDSCSLSNNLVQAIYSDRDKNELWIGTDNGLNYYDYLNDNFIRYYHYEPDLDRSFSDIVDIIPDTHGNGLWICSFYAGLSLFDKEKGTFKWIESVFYSSYKNDGSGINATVLFDDGNGSIWIGTDGNGIIQYNIKKKSVIRHGLTDADGVKIQNVGIRDFYLDSDNVLWVATSSGLFYMYLDSEKIDFRQTSFFSDFSLYSIKQIRNDEIWIAGDKGLAWVTKKSLTVDNTSTPKFHKYISTSTRDVATMSVRNIFIDINTNIWLSSYTGGAIMLPGTPPVFNPLFVKQEGNVNRKVKPLCIAEDNDTCLYIGTDGDGIYYQQKKDDDEWKRLKFENDDNKSYLNIIQTLHVSDGIVWAGTYLGGLVRYDLKTKKSVVFNSLNSKITGNDVRSIKQSGNDVWVGAKDGLTLFDVTGKIKKTYYAGQNGLYGHDVRQIVVLNDGNLWLTLYNGGIAYFDRKTEKFTTYKNDADIEESIPSNMISDIYSFDGKKLLVITRDGGVGIFYKGRFRRLEKLNDLYPHVRLFEDKDYNLWVATMHGIQRYNMRTHVFENYSNINISNVGTFYASLGLYSKNGNIYFGGENGIIFFNPYKVVKAVRPVFKPILYDFQLFNRSVAISDNGVETPLKRNIITEPDIELKHNQSLFSIYYTTTNYCNNSEMKYAYILEGESKEWSYVGNRNFAEFRNLPPGKYVFKVKASNQEGVWENECAKLNITVHPPFWKEPFMYVVYFILFVVILHNIFRFYTYRMRTLSKIKMERMKREQTEELYQSKLQFFTNVSHEFRTPLTLISEPVNRLVKAETDEDKKYLLSLVKRNADRMLQLVNQILDLRKIDRGGFMLRLRYMDIVPKLRTIVAPFEEMAKNKNIECFFISSFDSLKIFFDEELVTKCVSNILSNAFKFTPENGKIKVILGEEVDDGKKMVSITVSDTGIGMTKDVMDKIFDRFYQNPEKINMNSAGSGIGLHLVKELVELHHGRISVDSELGKGSSFSFLLPEDIDSYKKKDFVDETEILNIESKQQIVFENSEEKDKLSATEKDDRVCILVVDDDHDIRNYLNYCLKSEFRVLLAEDGDVAWSMIQENYVDLVLTDLMMPNLDGIQLCSLIKNDIATCHIAVILLTAKTAISSQIEGYEIGADGYVPKPFNWELLSALITSVIKRNKRLKFKYSQYLHNSVDEIKEEHSDRLENVQSNNQNDAFINSAIKIVEEEISNSEFNGEMLAERLIMSRVHLHRKLKSILNVSTSEFIRNIRLRKAAILLLEGNNNISEVCYLTGFSSPAYFSTCFTKFYGLSPREYVAKQHNK